MAEQPVDASSSSAVDQLAELIKVKNLANARKLVDVTSQQDAAWATRPDVLIQLARLQLRLGNEQPTKSGAGRAHFQRGLDCLEQALAGSSEVKEDYLWNYLMACIMGKLSEGQAAKEKIKNAYNIRDYVKKAMTISPHEPGPRNVLGRWCITVATIGRLARLAAKALFGAPPEATLQEALDHLLKANELESPESATFVMNLLALGEVHELMKNKAAARKWYTKCVNSREEQAINSVESAHERAMRAQARAALVKLK